MERIRTGSGDRSACETVELSGTRPFAGGDATGCGNGSEQFALQQLWEQRDQEQRELTFATYQQLGGVAGAPNQKAEAIYQRLEAAGQGDWVRRVLLKLVRTGEGTKDTRQRRPKVELLEMGKDVATRQTIELVITTLVDGHLLVSDRVNDQDVIDLSHEASIQRWQRLATWREHDRDLRRLVAPRSNSCSSRRSGSVDRGC